MFKLFTIARSKPILISPEIEDRPVRDVGSDLIRLEKMFEKLKDEISFLERDRKLSEDEQARQEKLILTLEEKVRSLTAELEVSKSDRAIERGILEDRVKRSEEQIECLKNLTSILEQHLNHCVGVTSRLGDEGAELSKRLDLLCKNQESLSNYQYKFALAAHNFLQTINPPKDHVQN